MLLPTDISNGVNPTHTSLLGPQPIAIAGCMTDLVIGGKGELHACPTISVPTSPSIACDTLHSRIVIVPIYSFIILKRIIYWQVDVDFERVAP